MRIYFMLIKSFECEQVLLTKADLPHSLNRQRVREDLLSALVQPNVASARERESVTVELMSVLDHEKMERVIQKISEMSRR